MSYNFKSFSELNGSDFIAKLYKAVKSEIESKGKEYILGVDETAFKDYLKSKYLLDPIIIDFESLQMDLPTTSKEKQKDIFYHQEYEVDAYTFTLRYHFSGSGVLFKIRPDTYSLTSAPIRVDESSNIVYVDFKIFKKDPKHFEEEKATVINRAFANLEHANQYAHSFNNRAINTINNEFQNQKSKFLAENDFFAAINIKVNPNTTSVFTAPTLQKKIIPQPTVSKNKEFSSTPKMSTESYDDILKVIYDAGKSMEKKPALYKEKNEEGLRDQFIFILETRYEATTASGETFNKGGKTDIILKYAPDATNIFVAECKFWHGSKEFGNAISQLFDRYLTWRDSKVALIFFVKNKDFTNVLQTIQKDVLAHPYYISANGNRGDSSFTYIFHLPQDQQKTVYLEIMAFHYDQ
ncbi:MAG: hypothetical protein EOO90_21695 [Pedobacter sp.]|nr:MAG: hypothetical protein EOO90_21695 [Pedobacter sp.]